MRGAGIITAGNPEELGLVPGSVNHHLMHVSDWLPTLCAVAGCGLNGTRPLDGVNQWPALRANQNVRTELLHDIYFGPFPSRFALRVGDWKVVYGQHGFDAPGTDDVDVGPFLFNIANDPGESHDVSKEHPDRLKALLAVVERYNASAVPPIYPDPQPESDPRRHQGAWVPWNGP